MIVGGIPMLFEKDHWEFVAAGVHDFAGDLIIPTPAQIQPGDLLILICSTESTDFINPMGWTQRINTNNTTSVFISDKIAGSSEPSVTVAGGGANSVGLMIAYRYINAVPLNVNGTINEVNGTSITTNSLTTTVSDALVLSVWCCNNNPGSWSVPAGVTTRVSINGDQFGNHTGILVGDENKESAGATTPRTGTFSEGGAMASFAVSYKE